MKIIKLKKILEASGRACYDLKFIAEDDSGQKYMVSVEDWDELRWDIGLAFEDSFLG